MKQKTLRPIYRLTLTQAALLMLPTIVKFRHMPQMVKRPDGKVDVAISLPLLDQLKTAALPQENLSNTVFRLGTAKAAKQ